MMEIVNSVSEELNRLYAKGEKPDDLMVLMSSSCYDLMICQVAEIGTQAQIDGACVQPKIEAVPVHICGWLDSGWEIVRRVANNKGEVTK